MPAHQHLAYNPCYDTILDQALNLLACIINDHAMSQLLQIGVLTTSILLKI
jgi:hypothetical protein